jgi:secondary thiamine-phosphate synthase enzyme
MVYSKLLQLRTNGNNDVIDLTHSVSDAVRHSKIKDGIVVVYAEHTTTAITTSVYEPPLVKDLQVAFEKLAPGDANYFHNREDDMNAHAHIRASLIGPSLSVPVEAGELALGHWQSILLLDFDNQPRTRRVRVQIVGDAWEPVTGPAQ